ncbi:MAG TPA: LacI family DNA-binding transcriptional regulator [Candidatus Goldiibacteriota bacterium]|nr:LacI family DNA-binding transcriptional regulator [Candidatus Goldiibacteriota bacterium]
MSITIKDVAKKVGVTATTVSMVIRDDPRISSKTKEKVLKAVKEMNYYPNQIGRSLVKGKTNVIAVASSMFYGPFKIDIFNGIDTGVVETEYTTLHFSARADQEAELLKEIVYGRRADGVIAINMRTEKETLQAYNDTGLPIVFVEETFEGFAGVKGDSFKGAYKATERFIKTGKKNIGLISAVYTHLACVTDREKGFMQALADNGIKYDEKKTLRSTTYNFQEGQDLMDKIIHDKIQVDSVFCSAGDLVAMGMIKRAKEKGVKIPGDIAIIGYDGLDTGSLVTPSLTTLKQPVVSMGRAAFDMLKKLMEEKDVKKEIKEFEPELIIRESA